MRSERTTAGSPDLHGRDGPLDVVLPDEALSPVARAFMAAGEAIGAPRLDGHNGGRLCGVSPNELTLRDGRRVTAADAYLRPVAGRPNLSLMTATTAVSLILDGDRAIGACLRGPDGRRLDLLAGRVVLCAGSIHSPLLLMRSGIGDPDILAAARVACGRAAGSDGNCRYPLMLDSGLAGGRPDCCSARRSGFQCDDVSLEARSPAPNWPPTSCVLAARASPIVQRVSRSRSPAPTENSWSAARTASRASSALLGPN